HGEQMPPPQSTSVSPPFFRSSAQLGPPPVPPVPGMPELEVVVAAELEVVLVVELAVVVTVELEPPVPPDRPASDSGWSMAPLLHATPTPAVTSSRKSAPRSLMLEEAMM